MHLMTSSCLIFNSADAAANPVQDGPQKSKPKFLSISSPSIDRFSKKISGVVVYSVTTLLRISSACVGENLKIGLTVILGL